MQGIGDIEGESFIATPVDPLLLSVDQNPGFEVNRTKMQEHSFSTPITRHPELALIPDTIVLTDPAPHTGKRRLHGERDQNRC